MKASASTASGRRTFLRSEKATPRLSRTRWTTRSLTDGTLRRRNAVEACFEESTIDATPHLPDRSIEAIEDGDVARQIATISGRECGPKHEEDVAIAVDTTLETEDGIGIECAHPPNATRPTSAQNGQSAKRSPQPQSSFAMSPEPTDGRSPRPMHVRRTAQHPVEQGAAAALATADVEHGDHRCASRHASHPTTWSTSGRARRSLRPGADVFSSCLHGQRIGCCHGWRLASHPSRPTERCVETHGREFAGSNDAPVRRPAGDTVGRAPEAARLSASGG